MPATRADGTYSVLRSAEPARTLVLAPEPAGSGPRFVIAGWSGGDLPAVVSRPRLERLADEGASGRFRLSCAEGRFEFGALGVEVLEDRTGLFDVPLAEFALRPRDRSVVRWLLRLLRLPGGARLLRAWHTRRG